MVCFFFRVAIVALPVLALAPAPASAQVGAGRNQLVLGTRVMRDARKPTGQLNTLNELIGALRACWRPPALEYAHPGMEMTMRFSFNRDGKLIGPPQVTYTTSGVTDKTRDVYAQALLKSLESCMPFPFTDGLAGAVAGRPFWIRIIDDRRKKPVELSV